MKIKLCPTNLEWINGPGDDPTDLCAHSLVEFTIAQTPIVKPSAQRYCVSAAALFLLRTIERAHPRSNDSDPMLFPCCGHGIYAASDLKSVTIIGCPFGCDVRVEHAADAIMVRSPDGRESVVNRCEWTRAVVGFSAEVRAFYARCLPKKPADSTDSLGFSAFEYEWSRRHQNAASTIEHDANG